VAILTDSLFAYDVTGSVASLTVLRGAIFGDLRMPEGLDPDADYEYMGHGVTSGRWRLLFHNGDWRQAGVPQHAMQFCNPPVVVVEANHPGCLPQQRSYLSADGKSSLLTVLKKVEDGDELIVRGYEYAGLEEPVKVVLEPAGREFTVGFGRYEIKTLRLGSFGATEVRILEDSLCEEDD
jgi:alpha-mannosidase